MPSGDALELSGFMGDDLRQTVFNTSLAVRELSIRVRPALGGVYPDRGDMTRGNPAEGPMAACKSPRHLRRLATPFRFGARRLDEARRLGNYRSNPLRGTTVRGPCASAKRSGCPVIHFKTVKGLELMRRPRWRARIR